MARASSPLVLVATLIVGIGLGLAASRVGPTSTVQATALPGASDSANDKTAATPKPRGATDEAIYNQLARQYENFEHVNRTFELVAKAVSPAVVHIVARKPGHHGDDGRPPHYEDETGSGVIVRPDGGNGLYVLTNNHVVAGASAAQVTITLHDGRVETPERFWSDVMADVAVLKLRRDDLPAARLGNSDDAAVGSWVVALGSPFGLTHSVSQGIISARNRYEEELEEDGVKNQEFLQTDAAINPGNSGGPLVNMKGEVIGINTAIASNGGGSEGVGFSIPINLAKWILKQLVANGKVSRGAMGVHLGAIQPLEAITLGLERPRGARIKSVHKQSPAFAAGLHDGDVILRFNGIDVLDFNHLINLVSMSPIGQRMEVVVWRDRKPLTASVAIADRDAIIEPSVPEAERPRANAPLRRPARP
jgi:serine protease Do